MKNQMQKTVIEVDLNSQKRKNSIFRSVSKLKGIDSIAADKNRLTVVGDVDPVEVIKSIRKIGMAEIISVHPDTPILLKTPVFDKSFQTASDSLEDRPYASAETGLEQQLEETDLGGVGQGRWLKLKNISSWLRTRFLGHPSSEHNIEPEYPPLPCSLGEEIIPNHPKRLVEEEYLEVADMFSEEESENVLSVFSKDLRGNANIHEQIKYPHLEHTNPHLQEQLDLDNLDSPIWPSRQGKVYHGHPKGHTLDYLDLQVCRQGTQPEGHALDYLDLQVSARAYNNPDGQGSTEFPDRIDRISRFSLVSADNHPDGQGSTEFPDRISRFRLVSADNHPDGQGSTEFLDIYRSCSNYAATRDFRDDIYGKDESGTSPKEERTTQELEKVILIPPLDLIDSIASQVSVIHTLDLSFTNIKSLPEFICKFISLRVFNLKGCQLLMELVPEIGELLNLEELDLEGTEIIYLPKQIAKLINLKSLKFTLCGCADQFQQTKRIGFVIPQKAFSNLLQLNELSIDVNPHGDWWNTEVKTVIDDLHCLQELKILRLYIPTVDLFSYLIQHIKLLIYQDSVCFRFTVGHHERLVSRLPEGVLKEFDDLEKFKKGLKFTSGEGMSIEITNALQHMDAFLLERHWSINNLLEFGLKSTEKLKCCILSECNELQILIDTKQHPEYDGIVLGSLQHLRIHYMKNMQKIWRGPVKKGSLSNLKSLALYTCMSLATVFKIDMLANLINLEEVRIEDCPKIKTLASSKFSDSMSQDFLPKLKSMLLLELPNLRCISSGLSIAPKLERLVILYCPNLKKLSTTEISSKDLQVLKGTKGWWDALKWYESDVTEADQSYLTSKFIPLREDGDLEEQFLRD